MREIFIRIYTQFVVCKVKRRVVASKIVIKCMTYEKLSCEVHELCVLCMFKCDTISKWLILIVC